MESSILSILQNNLYKHYMDEFGKEDESFSTYEAAEEKLKEAIKRGVSPENQIKIAEAMEDRALPAKDVVAYAKEDVVKEYIEEAQEKIYKNSFKRRMNQLEKETHRPMERLAPISKSKEMEVGE